MLEQQICSNPTETEAHWSTLGKQLEFIIIFIATVIQTLSFRAPQQSNFMTTQ